MSSYQIAAAFDNAAGLTALDPQPSSDGVLDASRVTAVSGKVYADGTPYTIWRYAKEITETQYASLLTQMGLTSVVSLKVTVKTNAGGNRATWSNYNAIIVKPEAPKYRKGFYRDIEFVVKLWEAL